MRWRFSFRVASFSSAFVLTMVMMRFLMRKARIFCWGEKEREKGERDRCEGWMTVQTHKTWREMCVSRFSARGAVRDRPVRGGFRRERFLFFSLFLQPAVVYKAPSIFQNASSLSSSCSDLTLSLLSSFKNNENCKQIIRPWRHFGVQKSANEPIRKHLSDQVGKRSGQILHLVLLGEEAVLRVQGAHEETRDGVQNHVG